MSRGQLCKDRAQELFCAASQSIGVREGVDAVIFAIRSTIENIERLQEKITEIEKLMTVSLHKISYAEHLLSIHGIGTVTLSNYSRRNW